MEEDEKKAVINFQTPKNKKAPQSFLGLCNWDKKCIQHLAEDRKPLELMLKMGQKYTWIQEQEDAFNRIKIKFKQAQGLNLMMILEKEH